MEVILLERVEKLGGIGDVVSVKNGFARNYLLPRKKALRANDTNKKLFEANRAKIESDNAERHRRAGQAVDEPARRGHGDPAADQRDDLPAEEKPVIPRRECAKSATETHRLKLGGVQRACIREIDWRLSSVVSRFCGPTLTVAPASSYMEVFKVP